jgi:response regulator RpfG family c-di-GMP phosphodiesterase
VRQEGIFAGGSSGSAIAGAIKYCRKLPAGRIPVVILTVSNDEAEILKSYNSHANCYITKPLDLMQFVKVVRSIEDFWLTIVKLPDGAA